MEPIVIWLAFTAFVLATAAFGHYGWEAAQLRLRVTSAFSYACAFTTTCLSALTLQLYYGS